MAGGGTGCFCSYFDAVGICVPGCQGKGATWPSPTLYHVYNNETESYGWICPRCFKSNAPFILTCDCEPIIELTHDGNSIMADIDPSDDI